MPWEEITPQRGRASLGAEVTVAWRKRAGSMHGRGMVLNVTIPAALMRALGWEPPLKVRTLYDRQTNRLRIVKADGEVGWSIGRRRGSGMFGLPLDHIQATETKSAQCVKHEVDNGAVVLALPPWAAPASVMLAKRAAGQFRIGQGIEP